MPKIREAVSDSRSSLFIGRVAEEGVHALIIRSCGRREVEEARQGDDAHYILRRGQRESHREAATRRVATDNDAGRPSEVA